MKNPTTHCQICGRATKAPPGYPKVADADHVGHQATIAHHGYRRPGHGWQTASCFGARWRPYEVASDALPPAIKSITDYLARTQAQLDALLASPPATLKYERRGAWKEVIAAKDVERPADFTVNADPDYRSGSYVTLFRTRRFALEGDLRHAAADKVTLEKRLANWRA